MKKIAIQSDVTGRELQKHTIRTHKEVAEILKISPEAVRVIEQRALAKCRHKIQFMMAQERAKQISHQH